MYARTLACFLLLGCSPAEPETDPDADVPCPAPLRASTIEQAVEAATDGVRADPRFVGLAVGVIDDGDAQTFYYGLAKLADATAPATPMSAESILRIGSNTKPFTATLLANQARLGSVSVGIAPGDPQETFLTVPDGRCTLSPPRSAITLGQLASHYSGLPKNTMPKPLDEDEVWSHLCYDSTAADTPGVASYSNFGYDVLGFYLAAMSLTGSWEETIQAVITDPLVMPDTRTAASLTVAQQGRVAEDYTTDATTGAIVAVLGNPIPPGDDPAGGLFSTLPDMMAWLSFNLRDGNESCQPADAVCQLGHSLGLLRTPRGLSNEGPGQIALGWNVADLDGCDHTVYSKSGSVGEYRSYVAYTLEPKKRGVVLMFNYAATDLAGIAAEILETIP